MTDILSDRPEHTELKQAELKQAVPAIELKEVKLQQEIGKLVTNTFDVMAQLRDANLARDANPFVLGSSEYVAITAIHLDNTSDRYGYLLHTQSAAPPEKLSDHQDSRTADAIKQGFVGGKITQSDQVVFSFEARGPGGEQYFANEPHPGFLGTIIYGPTGERLQEGDPQLDKFQAIIHQYELMLEPPPPEVPKTEIEPSRDTTEKAGLVGRLSAKIKHIKERANSGQTEAALLQASRDKNRLHAQKARENRPKQ
jgi:hypothetical protein